MSKDNRGGRREGAGRPKKKKEWSEEIKRMLMKEVSKLEKDRGKKLLKVFAETLFDMDVSDNAKVAYWKQFFEIMVVKESKQTTEHQEIKQVVMLPPVEPIPEVPKSEQKKQATFQ